MPDFLSLYKGKRVLITGHTGFKGSWLALWLHELGADVLGYALPPERENDHFNLLNLGKLITHIVGDVRNFLDFKRVLDDLKPEFVFHLAAQPLVKLSYNDPKLTFDTNISGSVNILEAVRLSNTVKSLVYITSDKCYKNKEWLWGYRENDELGGHDPYSASKAAAELVFSSYMDSFFSKNEDLGAGSVRAGNVIGGGDWSPDRIVPDCINYLKEKKPIPIRNPNATRPWQHVLEPLSGYLKLGGRLYDEPKKYSGSWNFGPKSDSIKTVQCLAEEIIKCWGCGEIEYFKVDGAPYESTLLQLNCDKANQILNWRPRWDFEKTVYETAKWYKEILSGSDALKITRRQIEEYTESLND